MEAANEYFTQTPHEKTAAMKRFIEVSGPQYEDVQMRVVKHRPNYTEVRRPDGEVDGIIRTCISYASWFLLRSTEPGERVTVKIRSDDVGLRI